jgi:hypothetical protein
MQSDDQYCFSNTPAETLSFHFVEQTDCDDPRDRCHSVDSYRSLRIALMQRFDYGNPFAVLKKGPDVSFPFFPPEKGK